MMEIPSRNSFRSSKISVSQSEERAIMKEEHWNLGRAEDSKKDTFWDKLIWWDPVKFCLGPLIQKQRVPLKIFTENPVML